MLWESAPALARYLLTNPAILSGTPQMRVDGETDDAHA